MERAAGAREELRVVPSRRARVDARRRRALSGVRRHRVAMRRSRGAHQRTAARERQQRAGVAARIGRPPRAHRLCRISIARHAAGGVASTARRAPRSTAAAIYFKAHGQMNLACTQCHDQNWGKRLLAETISQGHGNAFPAYRLEWQSVGSLQRRIRACLFRHSRGNAAAGRAGAHRPRALSRVAGAGTADRSARRAALASRVAAASEDHCSSMPVFLTSLAYLASSLRKNWLA